MSLIYVVEDDGNIREIEEYVLTSASYEVRSFENASDFRQALADRIPDLVLLDVMLPDEDGFAIVKELRENEATADIAVIMVTAKTAEIDRVHGLDSGADDYLTKPFGVLELLSRVKALLRRANRPVPAKENSLQEVLVNGDIRLDDQRHEVSVAGNLVELTLKEYEILKLLLKNAGHVVLREELFSEVWGENFYGESRTLDTHIGTLRRKLGSEGSRIRTIRNVGYTLDRDEDDGKQ
ncbi:MAG: response regulator transcription factor [Lachnospiraceae bacterium]